MFLFVPIGNATFGSALIKWCREPDVGGVGFRVSKFDLVYLALLLLIVVAEAIVAWVLQAILVAAFAAIRLLVKKGDGQ